jgi:5-methylcytosine-specific restriction protein A
VIALSKLLNQLPIIPEEERSTEFRNINGMHYQLTKFALAVNGAELTVGKIFNEVFEEYKENPELLFDIANAIKSSLTTMKSIPFGAVSENVDFKEGALISHLHRYFEREYLIITKDRFNFSNCEVCSLDARHIYKEARNDFCELHLLIPPKDYTDDIRLSKNDFMVVCPNCHKMFHKIRPWMGKNEAQKILR